MSGRVKSRNRSSTGDLGPRHRVVTIAQKLIGVRIRVAADNTDGQTNIVLIAVDVKGCLEGLHDLCGQ